MAIEFECVHCQRLLKLKDKCAGLTGECPYCKQVITVPTFSASPAQNVDDAALTNRAIQPTNQPEPDNEKPEFIPPTKKQLDYAKKLGVEIPVGVSRSGLSDLIDAAQDNAPATEKQREFLRELGVKCPDNILLNQASMLIDGAINIRDDISAALQHQLEDQWKAAGMLTEHATVEQLLEEIGHREKPIIAIILDNDEFRYQDLPMKGRLLWNNYLNADDVRYLITSLGVEFSKSIDMEKYSEEFDGTPPRVEVAASELNSEVANTVHLSVAPFGGLRHLSD